MCVAKISAAGKALGGLQRSRCLTRAIDRNLTGNVDHRREALKRNRRDRFQDLLVVPTRLARLLMEMHRRPAAVLEDRLQVAQQRRLTLILGAEVARQRNLVQGQPDTAGRTRVQLDPGLRVVVLGDLQGDPLERRERNRAYARSAAGDPASTPRKLGSWPPEASAPRSTATEPSGAVRSSWIWNLLIEIFIG